MDQSSLERVTPSEDNFDYEEQLVVLYNRVPKTGSTSFVNIAYDLCKLNRFHVLHINVTANMHVLSLPNQVRAIIFLTILGNIYIYFMFISDFACTKCNQMA